LKGNRFNLSNTEVGGDALALLDLNNVAWNNKLGVDSDPFAVAEHITLLRLHLLKSVKRTVSVAVLPDSHDGVQDKDQ